MGTWQLAPIDDGTADWQRAAAVDTARWPLRGLSTQQRRILVFLHSHHAVHGYAPTWREIADHCRMWSTSTAGYHLDGLEARGWIQRGRDRRGAIRLIAPSDLQVRPAPLAITT